MIEHMHPVVGKAPSDASYDESGQFMGPDFKVYQSYIQSGRAEDVAKIGALRPG